MEQDIINGIYQQYPWASEDTLQKVNSNMQEQNVHMGIVTAVLSKKDAAAIRELSRTAEQGEEKVGRLGRAAVKSTVVAGGVMKKIMSDQSPANAVAELSHEAAKLLANAGIGISNMGSGLGKFGAVMRGITRHAGTPIVVGTGLGVLFAKLLTEQEKQARNLIEFGAVVSDLEHWNNLRFATRDLGMALKDFESVMQETKPFIVKAEGSAFEGSLKMAEFAKAIDQDKTFRDFGMGIQDQTRFIGQELETLYELGEVTAFNEATKKRVIQSYRSANNLALFTGDVFGMQREEALRLRDEARNNVELRVGLMQNKAFIEETYGEMAAKNISDATGVVRVLNEQLLGSEFAQQMEQIISGFVGDIKIDQSAANNITEDLLKQLQGAPGVTPALISFIEKLGTGQFENERETIEAYREVFKLIKDAPMVVTAGDPSLQAFNELVAAANTASGATEFLQADLDTVSSDFYANLADQADASIEVMNNMAIAFQNAQELLTPGYDTMATGFETLTDGILGFGRAISRAFGDEERFDQGLANLQEKRIESRLAQVNEHNIEQNIAMMVQEIDLLEDEISGNRNILYDESGDKRENPVSPIVTDEQGNEIGGEELTEEQIAVLEQRYIALESQLLQAKEYKTRLEEKQTELMQQEEAAGVGN